MDFKSSMSNPDACVVTLASWECREIRNEILALNLARMGRAKMPDTPLLDELHDSLA